MKSHASISYAAGCSDIYSFENSFEADKYICIAVLGSPVLEVAAVVRTTTDVFDVYHAIIAYNNHSTQEALYECEPTTDSFGTRFTHAISELELDHYGLPIDIVRHQLDTFLNLNYEKCLVFVNDVESFQSLQIHREVLHMTKCPRSKSVEKTTLSILRVKKCQAHHSIYFTNPWKPQCALALADAMSYSTNQLR